jgi:putative phage-type endonuclease
MSFYVVEDLEQGTSEWLSWRQGVIGASDAPTIMGENPWASSTGLLEEKLGLRRTFAGNAATREGHYLEDFARQELCKKYKKILRPSVIQDANHPFLAASLDAIDSTNSFIFEIKSGAKAYERTKNTHSVPGDYVGQLQHMLMVTEQESLVYAVYRPDEPLITIEVFRDESYITRLRETELQFIKDLASRGHVAQVEFVGHRVN